jgi:hypothetical protein
MKHKFADAQIVIGMAFGDKAREMDAYSWERDEPRYCVTAGSRNPIRTMATVWMQNGSPIMLDGDHIADCRRWDARNVDEYEAASVWDAVRYHAGAVK